MKLGVHTRTEAALLYVQGREGYGGGGGS